MTRSSAEIRNKQVLDIVDSIVVGCVKRRGMTEKLITQYVMSCLLYLFTHAPIFIIEPKFSEKHVWRTSVFFVPSQKLIVQVISGISD